MCDRMEKEADEEGFPEIAGKFCRVADIDKAHEERYRKLLRNVEIQQVFAKSVQTIWECRICGHLVIGTEARKSAPVYNYSKSHFEVGMENY